MKERLQAPESFPKSDARPQAAHPPAAINAETLSPDEVRDLIHELHTHRIELEMQNEELRRAQEELRASRDRYSDLFDLAPVGYLTLSDKGLIVEANLTLADMFAVERGALHGRSVTTLIVDEDQDIYYRHRHALLETGESPPCELRLRRKDQTSLWVSMESVLTEMPATGESLVRVAVSDITRRRRVEEVLAEKEHFFRNVFNSIQDGISVLDTDMNIVHVNGVMERWYAHAMPLVGRKCHEAYHQRNLVCERCPTRKALETGSTAVETVPLTGEGGTCQGWLELYAFPLVEPSTGELAGVIEYVRDITPRRNAESHLRVAQFALEKAAEGIFWVDEDAAIFYANESACRLLGYERDELAGLTVRDISPGFDGNRWQCHWESLKQRGSMLMETFARARDGRIFPVETSANFVEFEGKQYSFAFVRDVSERKRAEQEKALLEEHLRKGQKLEAMGTLSGGIAHEFNNLLAGIVGFTELMLLDAGKGTRFHEDLVQVYEAALRGKQLTRQLLAFSRPDDSEHKPVDLVSLVSSSMKMVSASLPSFVVVRQSLPREAAIVVADPAQVHQVLVNLCMNAGQAMEETGGILEVSLSRASAEAAVPGGLHGLADGDCWKLTVSDTGQGMDQSTQERAAEPFFTTKQPGEGTGLGLSVVHGIVESHRGLLQVNSTPGQGTTIDVYLPVAGQAVFPGVPEAPPGLVTGSGRILFVDDEPTLVLWARKALGRLGYTVTTFTRSEEAYEAFRCAPGDFDLLVTDLTMPGMDGIRLAVQMRTLRPDLPVVLCTGRRERLDAARADDLEIQRILVKPVSLVDLATTLHELCTGMRK